jgi:hypothetical protein
MGPAAATAASPRARRIAMRVLQHVDDAGSTAGTTELRALLAA